MVGSPIASIEQHFADLDDPRIDRSKLHRLLDIVVLAICAIICGADDWVAVETFGNAKHDWLKEFLKLPNGIPSHDTFGRVFAALDPDQFQSCFLNWISAASEITQGQVIALDGKTLRRSHDKTLGKKAIVMVSAWATANGLVLGQRKVDEKSNEITAIPELLQALEISGCIITIDAMSCQKEIAAEIVDQDADYVLALKENHGNLYDDVELLFDDLEESQFSAYEYDYQRTINKGHGRIEVRQCWTISDPDVLRFLRGTKDWEKLTSLVKVQAKRRTTQKTTIEDRYYLSNSRLARFIAIPYQPLFDSFYEPCPTLSPILCPQRDTLTFEARACGLRLIVVRFVLAEEHRRQAQSQNGCIIRPVHARQSHDSRVILR